jgi:hypothetical protein
MTKITTGMSNSSLVSRAVEEPIDATFELGDKLERQASKLTQTITIGVIGSIFLILLFGQNIYEISRSFIDLSLGNLSISYSELIKMIVSGFIIILFTAIIITITIYLLQINKFNKHLQQRYELVAELKKTDNEDIGGSKKKATGKTGKTDTLQDSGLDLKIKPPNPIFATLDLIEEAIHETPQIIRLLKISKYFMLTVFIFVEMNILSEIIFNYSLFYVFNLWELAINFGVIFFVIYSVYLLKISENIFKFIHARHEIIDSIRFGEPAKVPKGKTPLLRLLKYLTKTDPYLIKAGASKESWPIGEVEITGSSGQKHLFEGYFKGVNDLRELSSRICVPTGEFSVFIKVFKKSITLQGIKRYHQAVLDVCAQENTFPLRVIALQRDIDDLDDDVYDYVIDSPILFKSCNSHIQIVAEDGNLYSFIPQISYGVTTSDGVEIT